MKRYSAFLKTPALLEPYYQIVCVTSKTCVGMQSVYCTVPADWVVKDKRKDRAVKLLNKLKDPSNRTCFGFSQKNFCQDQMVNSENNLWLALSPQDVPIVIINFFIYCGLFVLILVVFVLFLISLRFGQISPLAFFR